MLLVIIDVRLIYLIIQIWTQNISFLCCKQIYLIPFPIWMAKTNEKKKNKKNWTHQHTGMYHIIDRTISIELATHPISDRLDQKWDGIKCARSQCKYKIFCVQIFVFTTNVWLRSNEAYVCNIGTVRSFLLSAIQKSRYIPTLTIRMVSFFCALDCSMLCCIDLTNYWLFDIIFFFSV